MSAGCTGGPTKICSTYYDHPLSNQPAPPNGTHGDAQSWYNNACNSAISAGDLPSFSTESGDSYSWTNYARRGYVCIGGAGNTMCSDSYDCGGQPQVLCNVIEGEPTGFCAINLGGFADSTPTKPTTYTPPGRETAFNLLQQFFARFYSFWQYEEPDLDISGIANAENPPIETGYYEKETTNSRHVPLDENGAPLNVDFDITPDGDNFGSDPNDGNPSAPVVYSVSTGCTDDGCPEDSPDAMSLNGNSAATFYTEGNFRADLRFFATTDPNQFPIRKVLVDWGDGQSLPSSSSTDALPSELWARSPLSAADNNYYKAHRGLKADQSPWCTDVEEDTEWGLTSQSCETGPFNYGHHYRCTPLMLNWLQTGRNCISGAEGNLQNSPCTGGDVPSAAGACVFQPRVYIQDNWNYCTGVCDDGSGDTLCHSTSGSTGECDYANFPLPESLISPAYADPWVYYDGYIVLEP